MDTQNAWIVEPIRSGYGSGTAAPALPGGHRGLGQLHRRGDRARRLAGGGVQEPDRPGAGARGPVAAPHQPEHRADHGRGARAGPGQAGAGGGRQPDRRGDHRAHQAAHRARVGRHGEAHPRVPAPLGGPVPGRRAAADPHQLGHRRAGRGPVRHRGDAHRRGRQALRQCRRGPGTPLLRAGGGRPVGGPAFHRAERDTAAVPAGRPAYRDHHPGLVAGRRPARHP
jgi:hypothetical protein